MIAYAFAGCIVGLFMVSIFTPVTHAEQALPVPGVSKKFHTKTGCILVHSEEVSCSTEAISLNLINDRKDSSKS
jgi:hypothetical protein